MGQAKRRGTQDERIALALAWEEAHAEEWRRRRIQREAEEARRPKFDAPRISGAGRSRVGNRLLIAALLATLPSR